jgi:hypothetical protein
LSPTILASDAVHRLFDEPLVIVTPRAAIVNLGQIDGRHVCVSVDRFVLFISSSLHALPHSGFGASLPVFTGFMSIVLQACGLAREYHRTRLLR